MRQFQQPEFKLPPSKKMPGGKRIDFPRVNTTGDPELDRYYQSFGYEPPFETFQSLFEYTSGYGKTPCQEQPGLCEPAPIKHVVWDADDTIWDLAGCIIASEMDARSPIKRVSKDVVEQTLTEKAKDGRITQRTCRITLRPGMRNTLDELESRGVSSSIASINNKPSVDVTLKALGLDKRFAVVEAAWTSKSDMVDKIGAITGINPSYMIFVDNEAGNVHDVLNHNGSLPLVMDVDIMEPEEVLKYITKE